jgi:hypothetical protein
MNRRVNFKRYRMNVSYLDELLIRSKQFKHQSMGSMIKKILWRIN